jgi:hypothetical protein
MVNSTINYFESLVSTNTMGCTTSDLRKFNLSLMYSMYVSHKADFVKRKEENISYHIFMFLLMLCVRACARARAQTLTDQLS